MLPINGSKTRVLAFGLCVLFGACSGKEQGTSDAPAPSPGASTETSMDPAAAKQEAQQLFASVCTPCHGEGGKGDGPASKGLTPKPRDLTSADWQTSVTDEHIEKIIVYGGLAVGLSGAMPGNPNLDSKPQVVQALRAHIRDFGK